MLLLRRVQGVSMQPLLRDGQLVLLWGHAVPRIGKVFLINDDGEQKIKIITRVDGQRVWYSGANQQSTDSRDKGWVVRSSIRATLLWPRISDQSTIHSTLI